MQYALETEKEQLPEKVSAVDVEGNPVYDKDISLSSPSMYWKQHERKLGVIIFLSASILILIMLDTSKILEIIGDAFLFAWNWVWGTLWGT